MAFDIEFINTTEKTVDYTKQAETDFDAGDYFTCEKYTEIFEAEYGVEGGEDIGGLIVYGKAGQLQAVYDYENFCGWVV
jgi:hypothetical protein